MTHIEEAHLRITSALADAVKPAAMVSFGKDSLVLIDLLAEHGVKAALYLEDDDEVIDRPFIQSVVDRYELQVMRMNRGRGMFFVVKDQPLFLAFPFVSRQHFTPVPTNMIPYDPTSCQDFHCVDDMLSNERGAVLRYDPDFIFCGFKKTDVSAKGCLTFINLLGADVITDKLARIEPLTELAPGMPLCLPLLDWTDDQVWAYLRERNLPWSHEVYTMDGKRRPTEKQWCFRCHDPRESSIVFCPKLSRDVLNLAAMTKDTDLQLERLVRLGIMSTPERGELTNG